MSDLEIHPVTKRYVFVVEYCCKPAESGGNVDNCHGWLKYRSSRINDQIQKPFKRINDLPQLIDEIVAGESEEPV